MTTQYGGPRRGAQAAEPRRLPCLLSPLSTFNLSQNVWRVYWGLRLEEMIATGRARAFMAFHKLAT